MIQWPPPWPWVVCLSIILLVALISLTVIFIREGKNKDDGLRKSDLWKSGWSRVNPRWLLLFRSVTFVFFASVAIYDTVTDVSGFSYFTIWNFILLAAYFGLGTLAGLLYIPWSSHTRDGGLVQRNHAMGLAPGVEVMNRHPIQITMEDNRLNEPNLFCYAMQIVYQICLPMSVLVDVVVWTILFPEAVRANDYANYLTFVRICQHALNFVACFIEFCLNRMKFPWFRVAYVLLWGITYVLFQWLLHDVYGKDWAYSFLPNDKPVAILWYSGILTLTVVSFALWRWFDLIKQKILGSNQRSLDTNFML